MKFKLAVKKVLSSIRVKAVDLLLIGFGRDIDTRTLYWEEFIVEEMIQRNHDFQMDSAFKTISEETTRILEEICEEQRKEQEKKMKEQSDFLIVLMVFAAICTIRRRRKKEQEKN